MYIENNRKILLFSQATGNVDTDTAVVVSISHMSINMKMYFRKRQSSELSGSVELSLRVLNLLVELLGTALRNGVLGAVPTVAWRHSDGCLSASWTPGVYEGSWGSLNLRDPVFNKGVIGVKQYEAGKKPYQSGLQRILSQENEWWTRCWRGPQ